MEAEEPKPAKVSPSKSWDELTPEEEVERQREQLENSLRLRRKIRRPSKDSSQIDR